MTKNQHLGKVGTRTRTVEPWIGLWANFLLGDLRQSSLPPLRRLIALPADFTYFHPICCIVCRAAMVGGLQG